jgi:hypothetical protein
MRYSAECTRSSSLGKRLLCFSAGSVVFHVIGIKKKYKLNPKNIYHPQAHYNSALYFTTKTVELLFKLVDYFYFLSLTCLSSRTSF